MNRKLYMYMTSHALALAWHMLVACGVTPKHTHAYIILHSTHTHTHTRAHALLFRQAGVRR